ncbi:MULTISPECIES: helix-turn-helix domain-containing protein [Methanosarcina]|nr:helix-turn-helix domain-containing protein [Methanosarcina barkeri]
MYPKKGQKRLINIYFGACIFVYNWTLEYLSIIGL